MKKHKSFFRELFVVLIFAIVLAGCKKESAVLPVVSTGDVTARTHTSITCGGTISNFLQSTPSSCGICWSRNPDPDISDSVASAGLSGNFTCAATGLSPKTKYYLRAFAINDAGVSYGQQTECITPDELPVYLPLTGLVGWWPFNGNAIDESGNVNDGTVYGAKLTTDRFGVSDRAYNFDGVGDMIKMSSLLKSYSSSTISVWVKSNSNSQRGLMVYDGNSGSNGYGLAILENCTGTSGNKVRVLAGGIDCNIGGSEYEVPMGIWTHIVLQKAYGTFTLYINNNYVTKGCQNPRSINGNLYVGCDAAGGSSINGCIDDISIWSRALSQQEITALYNAGN